MIEILRPARSAPPGRIVAQELEVRNWSQEDLATRLDCTAPRGYPDLTHRSVCCSNTNGASFMWYNADQ